MDRRWSGLTSHYLVVVLMMRGVIILLGRLLPIPRSLLAKPRCLLPVPRRVSSLVRSTRRVRRMLVRRVRRMLVRRVRRMLVRREERSSLKEIQQYTRTTYSKPIRNWN